MWVRPLDPSDCDALEATFGPPGFGIEPRAELARALTRGWIAGASDGALLGYALAWLVVDELQLLWLVTHPGFRRRGVARALLRRLIDDGEREGARRVTLEVSRDNAAALTLYESFGFTLFNVRRGYYRETGADALELALDLPGAQFKSAPGTDKSSA